MIRPKPRAVIWVWFTLLVLLGFPLWVHAGGRNPVQKIDLARFQKMINAEGHFLLVFMAAWCAPCVKELPDLNALHSQFRDSGLKMVGVSVDYGGPSAIQPILDRLKVEFPVVWLGEEALDAYDITGIPLLIFIKNGAVVDKVMGQHSKAFFAQKITSFLSLPQTP